jgi:RNA-directed DNA polymerase
MNGAEKSDPRVVAEKPANKAARAAAEPVERRGGIEENARVQSTDRTQSWAAVSQAQERIRQAITRNQGEKLTALLHHVGLDCLRWAFFALKKEAAPGVDGVTWGQYAADLDRNLTDLHARVHSGAYRALPSRRKYIPKSDGGQRPLGIAGLEDKLVQTAVVAILTPVYEAEFLGFSYGFRPGRGPHDALDALAAGITRKRIRWILDADIRRFFDQISHAWLVSLIEMRIGDRRIIRLIHKWLKAGVLEEGRLLETLEGTPQGASVSPLLANIFLHYVYDLWANEWRKHQAQGDMIIVRYADDTVVGFEHRQDAERFTVDLQERLGRYGLSLHPDKTRLTEFGKDALASRRRGGRGQPGTFDFLGFTHYCSTRRNGTGFVLGRKPIRKRMRAKLREIKEALRRRMHDEIAAVGRWLGGVVRGWYAYFAVPTSFRWLSAFRWHVGKLWMRTLRRRSQKHNLTWDRMSGIIDRFLPRPRIHHPWPEQRFAVRHPR